jgi:hypothetical protein
LKNIQPRYDVNANGDTFNVVEAITEAPISARCGQFAGVIERGMYREKMSGT